MLAVETQPPPLFRKPFMFRRFARKDRPLEISSPIMPDTTATWPTYSPRSPRQLLRRPPEHTPNYIFEATTQPLVKPTTHPKPFVRHTRVDSASFADLPVTFAHSHSRGSSRSSNSTSSSRHSTDSTSTTSSTQSRVLRNAHPTRPFSQHTRIGAWNIFLPPSHVHALYTGVCPNPSISRSPSPSSIFDKSAADTETSDRFIFSEGPDTHGKLKVHFHTAATGTKVAEVFVVMDLKGEGAGKVVGIKWNSNGTGEEGAKGWVRRVCWRSLGIGLEGEI